MQRNELLTSRGQSGKLGFIRLERIYWLLDRLLCRLCRFLRVISGAHDAGYFLSLPGQKQCALAVSRSGTRLSARKGEIGGLTYLFVCVS
jgi:hypothetical protein